jgi:two-component system, NarL family, sensor histidine kinase DesK
VITVAATVPARDEGLTAPVATPVADSAAPRVLAMAFLGALLVARCADAADHHTYDYLPFAAALFVLPLWYCSGLAPRAWQRGWPYLLAGQAAFTYLPFALFGDHWVGGVSGLLAGLLLLVAPSPRSWWLAAAVLAVDAFLWNVVVGVPVQPAVNGGLWVVIASADNALALFGLARLSIVVRELATTQQELARVAVQEARSAVDERLRLAVVDRLYDVAGHARAALRWLSNSPVDAREETTAAGREAREALAEGRHLYARHGSGPAAGAIDAAVPAPRLARAVLVSVALLFATQNGLNLLAPAAPLSEVTDHPTLAMALGIAASVVTPVLAYRHAAAGRNGGRPRYWPWTLLLQAVAIAVEYLFLGAMGLIFAAFLGGSVLVLVRPPGRWLLFAGVVAGVPLLSRLDAGESMPASYLTYETAITLSFGLMVYGLSRLSGLAALLAARRQELAMLAEADERQRLARDTHDLLGMGMSAMAMKADLVVALIGRDDARAARELAEIMSLCATVRSDAARIAGERGPLRVDEEVRVAADVLDSAGIHVHVTAPPTALPVDVDETLAIVVREAVTNILRHSAAQHCTITFSSDSDERVCLRVSNDGVWASASPEPSGNGIANLRFRVESSGGRLEVQQIGDTFVVKAELPVRVPTGRRR